MSRRIACSSSTSMLLIGAGVILLFLRTWIFDLMVSTAFVLGPNSPILNLWLSPPLQVKVDLYLFNWTNPDDIHNVTIKPRFQELGPYRFILDLKKVNVTWNSNNTVSFRTLQSYYFDEKNSAGRLSDLVTTLNTVAVSAAHSIRNEGYFTKKGFSLSTGMLAPQIHVTKSAGQLLFEGYQDPFIDLVQTLPFLADTAPPVDKAGFLYGKNGSYTSDGVFNVATGRDGNAGEMLNWNYLNETPYYEGSCRKLRGSVGELYHQRQTKDYVTFFTAYACRNLILDYEEDVTVRNINGYKFSAQQGMLDNGTLIPENKCLCNGECVPSGMLNMSSCAFGAPSFLSLPHFYGADSVYLNKIEGLQPEKTKHETFITIQPRLGVCIDIALRFQLNFLLQPVKHITLLEQVPKAFFPLLWLEQKASIPVGLAWLTSICLSLPDIILPVLAVALIIAGISLLANNKYKLFSKHRRTRNFKGESDSLEKTPLQDNNGDDRCSTTKIIP